EPGGIVQPGGDDGGRGEDLPRLAERQAVELEHLAAQGAVLRGFGELAELGAVEIPRLTELVQQPDDLARMTHAVRRKPRRQVRVDRTAARSTRRSEEHTSELQSPYDLVCRLLLEKK